MKCLLLSKGEAGYIVIPEGTQIVTDNTETRQKGKRLILVRVI